MKKTTEISAVILAGGKSLRMNGNKALLPVSGVRLIEKITNMIENYFNEIIISSNSREIFDFLPYEVVIDEKSNQGPMMGILSCLKVSSNDVNFVIACDIPEINFSFIEKMMPYTDNFDIVVPISGENQFEPLFAFYNKNLISSMEKLLNQGVRKISELFQKCRTKYIPLEKNRWYYNLNSKKDYDKYLKTKINKPF